MWTAQVDLRVDEVARVGIDRTFGAHGRMRGMAVRMTDLPAGAPGDGASQDRALRAIEGFGRRRSIEGRLAAVRGGAGGADR